MFHFPFFQKCDTYQLIMEVRDMAGQPFGLFNTGTITISLEDENDNPPCFTQNSVSISLYSFTKFFHFFKKQIWNLVAL